MGMINIKSLYVPRREVCRWKTFFEHRTYWERALCIYCDQCSSSSCLPTCAMPNGGSRSMHLAVSNTHDSVSNIIIAIKIIMFFLYNYTICCLWGISIYQVITICSRNLQQIYMSSIKVGKLLTFRFSCGMTVFKSIPCTLLEEVTTAYHLNDKYDKCLHRCSDSFYLIVYKIIIVHMTLSKEYLATKFSFSQIELENLVPWNCAFFPVFRYWKTLCTV